MSIIPASTITNRGFLNLGPDVAPQLQTLAQRKTLAQMVNTACNEDILERANKRAKIAVTTLLGSNKKREVIVNTTPAPDCKITE